MAAKIQLFRAKLFAVMGLKEVDLNPFADQLNEADLGGDEAAERLLMLARQYLRLLSRPVQVLRETRRIIANQKGAKDRDFQLSGWELLTLAAVQARRFRQALHTPSGASASPTSLPPGSTSLPRRIFWQPVSPPPVSA